MTDSEQTATDRVREYYDALRGGEPLAPFFAEDPSVVKYGITEKLTGYEAIEAGLREQSATTENWRVESSDLRVVERGEHAWFSDDVRMAWDDAVSDHGYDFDSRWSGTLERRGGTWLFVGMHVSAVPE
ncbi:nuclear transport factor 2 family protein [Halobellus captivus]|uniref:nuclear transport factor 2 family protein n=1 Tax=Halobellus captivus TaxID=2592614 RepID=UPI0011A73C70|nr:nuclear transport factor 2 family protein [Halobellus captivus]